MIVSFSHGYNQFVNIANNRFVSTLLCKICLAATRGFPTSTIKRRSDVQDGNFATCINFKTTCTRCLKPLFFKVLRQCRVNLGISHGILIKACNNLRIKLASLDFP
ncbi:hypothetical protein HanPSC8_Chr13g0568321 [Helianthus annuus]|nr:hypothetical protein HanPSC8_Chr13g0568321 [Helianthus annuus]